MFQNFVFFQVSMKYYRGEKRSKCDSDWTRTEQNQKFRNRRETGGILEQKLDLTSYTPIKVSLWI